MLAPPGAVPLAPHPAEAQLKLPPLDKILPPPPAPPPAPPVNPGVKPPGPAGPSKPGGKAAASQGAPPGPVPAPASQCGPAPSPPKVKRQRGGTTFRLLELVRPLLARGLEPRQAMVLAAPPFPVAGPARYSDDWLAPRLTPCPHLHHGTDIFADFGTPIVASGPGTLVAMGRGPVGGLAIWVAGDDGNSFYYAHLQAFAVGLRAGQRVDKGTVLGEVGDTGNAEGGAPHLHFQIHPPVRSRKKGIVAAGVDRQGDLGSSRTAPANPVGYLNEMLEQAQSNAPTLVEQLLQSQLPLLQLNESSGLITLGQALPGSSLRQAEPLTPNQGVAKTASVLGILAGLTALATLVASWRLVVSSSRSTKAALLRRPHLAQRPSLL